jgi:hypothetical protein
VRVAHTFVGTVAHTLLYDSDRYPSGHTVTAGETVTGQNCPGQRRLDVFHRSPASLERGPSPSPAAPPVPAPAPATLAFRKLPDAVLPELPLALPL